MSAVSDRVGELVRRLCPAPAFAGTPEMLERDFKNLIRLHCPAQDPKLLVNLAQDGRDHNSFTLAIGGNGRLLRSGAGMLAKGDFVFQRKTKRKFALTSYSFSVLRPLDDQTAPAFVRFDLDAGWRADFVDHPRAHLHPGSDKVRVLAPVVQPLELLHWFLALRRWPGQPMVDPPAEQTT